MEALFAWRSSGPVGGRLVRTFMDEPLAPPGHHEVRIDAHDEGGGVLASGVYFNRVDTLDGVARGRLVVIK